MHHRMRHAGAHAGEGLDAPGGAGLRMLAHALHALGAQLGLRWDTFSLGPAASLIGAASASCAACQPVPACLCKHVSSMCLDECRQELCLRGWSVAAVEHRTKCNIAEHGC